jgi:hypothetical protein
MPTPRKHSTGTLGRIDAHADDCRAFVRQQTAATNPSLAEEFIKEIQGTGKEFDVKKWLRFENMEQLKAELNKWLKGE